MEKILTLWFSVSVWSFFFFLNDKHFSQLELPSGKNKIYSLLAASFV
jgi:hypothetical protein